MKVKDYMGQLVDEKVEAKLKALDKAKSKGAIVDGGKESNSDDRELNKKFWQAIASRDTNKLVEVKALIEADYKAKGQTVGTIGSGTGGGILVPTTVADSIITKMNYISPIRQLATVIPNMPARFQLPSENAMVQAYWVNEGADITESSEVFDPNLLDVWKLAGLDSFTSEVIADAATNPSIQNYVESRFSVAMSLLENNAFVNGDGSSKPYGFRSSAITPNSVAQDGDLLGYSDVVNLKYSLATAYRQLAVYVVGSAGAQALENVRDNQNRPIWREGLTEDTPARLLGRPVYVVDEMPDNLGAGSNQTEIWYGVFSNYFIGDRGGLRIDYGTRSGDFIADKIALRVIRRVAGRPVMGESFSKLTAVM
jgi:HK97 family phage major capsid protein